MKWYWWVIGLVVLGALAAAVWYWTDVRVERSTKKAVGSSSSSVTWAFNGQVWKASGTPPACAEPIKFQTPTSQLAKATGLLYPGQMRSTGYKPHGGLRFDGAANTDIDVRIPIDGHLVSASRYIEQGETQYFFTFTTPCGIGYRFDHLLTLTPKFQAVADKLPAAQVDDSRTTPVEPPLAVDTGEEVATAVGFTKTSNVSFDFGVYDLRKKNGVSGLPANDQQFAPYGICWFDLLPTSDVTTVRNLPPADSQIGSISDYCK